MKPPKNLILAALTLALTSGAWAQHSASNREPDQDKSVAPQPSQSAITAADIQSLKKALAAQQLQIQALRDELHRRGPSPQTTVETVSVNNTNGATVKNAVLQDSLEPGTPDSNQIYNKQMEGALTIHFKGINITPGGYAAGESVWRSRGLAADVSTPFNSLTVPGASQSQVSEFFGSGRQSKTTAFVDGRLKNVDLSSYVSADFLSAGVTSTSTSTNSYTLRLRQAWGQAKFDNGWSFLGGQSFSLATENGKGISPDDDLGRTNDARPKTVDSSYSVGFVYTRQYGIRVTKNFGDKVAFAVAMENAQATLTTHGNGNNFLLGEAGASNSYNTTTNYTFNPSPDIIAKVAFDPGFGHYEIFGLFDRFRDRVFPCGEVASASALCGGSSVAGANGLGAYNASKNGGGVGASARWLFAKHVVFGVKGFGGSGIGRYAPGGLSDAAIDANGKIHLIKNFEGLGTLEWRGKKFDVYGYAGVEYAGRAVDFDPLQAGSKTKGEVGYGAKLFNNSGCYTELAPAVNTGFTPTALANCTADTRALIEGTLGFWYRFYSGPKGKLQYGTQYSYVTRQTWSGVGGDPHGLDAMVFTSFRYYLP